jgi:methyltransferase (TIGR00027 family)
MTIALLVDHNFISRNLTMYSTSDFEFSGTYSHADETRNTVGATAHAVAYMRCLEEELHPHDPLFRDPYARALGEKARDWVENEAVMKIQNLTKEEQRNLMARLMAIRTKKIDDTLINVLQQHSNINQICVLGAGLDSRPWRLEALSASNLRRSIKYFELDFQEIFNYKLPVLEESEANTVCEYISVIADLSLPSWSEKLIEKGWNAREGSLWLLEGLTPYLTESENIALFRRMHSLSGSNSFVLSTFEHPSIRERYNIPLFRFLSEAPIEEVSGWAGWRGEEHDFEDAAIGYGRPAENEKMNLRGYILAVFHN